MTRKLRSVFEPGTTLWAMRRAQWSVLGITPEDELKPKIAIVNSSSHLASCFSHLDDIVPVLSQAIRDAGGVPLEIRTAASSDAITSAGRGGQYILPTRDLIVDDIEVAVEGAQLDGMVCLASCDKTAPGQLMAAGRLNIPTIIVACGYQSSGTYKGEHIDFEDVFHRAGQVASGMLSIRELGNMASAAVTGPGVCSGMGTANTMHIVCEALGMAMTNSTPVRANGDKMWSAVRRAGERIVELVEQDVRPRDILVPDAFRNAVAAVLAISGSVNVMKHLQAVAAEAECDVDVWRLFEELGPQVPLLVGVKPNGERLIEEFDDAGGALALLSRLRPLLVDHVATVTGPTLGELLDVAEVLDDDVVRSLDNGLANHPAISVLRGTLAPDSAVVKRTVADTAPLSFTGPARVFHSRDSGMAAIKDGRVHPGDVVVLSGLGMRGSPGMAMTSAFIFALDGAGLSEEVAVVTDGQMSGLVNRGLVVAEVAPEAWGGGPLGLVQDGDVISIDVNAGTIDLLVDPVALETRRAASPTAVPAVGCGWLSTYAREVSALNAGAVLRG
ncbi:dihydroxy-acid dehydratase [Parafrigoribacterium mesophilum]|uniref:dihydroxy-acid dehydratase n=1 Tax=Parafrigoribacterium mesophilum TaxID=433646 RepID=UPI0031FCAB44